MSFFPPSSWLADACKAIGQTPETLSAYLTSIGVPNVVGTVEEVEAACAAKAPACSRPMLLGWPMNRDWHDRMLVRRQDAHGADMLQEVLRQSPDFLAIVVPPATTSSAQPGA